MSTATLRRELALLRCLDDALFRPEVRHALQRLIEQGWTDALRFLQPDERIYTFWDYFRNVWGRDAADRSLSSNK